jgi:hypothetical protein
MVFLGLGKSIGNSESVLKSTWQGRMQEVLYSVNELSTYSESLRRASSLGIFRSIVVDQIDKA